MEQEAPKLILLVDDDKDFAEIVTTKLAASGFRAAVAHDGSEGLQLAHELRPDLILLDIQMPGMTGAEMFFKMKEEDRELSRIKVIFLTSYGEPRKEDAWLDEKFAKDMGALDYIRKTDDLDSIVTQVRTAFLAQNPF